MTPPIHVDFNRRDADDLLVAATRRIDALPEHGQTVDIVDDEDNRALARVVRVDARTIVLEPLWQTFASAGRSRIVPSAAPARFLETWSSATTVSYGTVVNVREARVEAVSGGPTPRLVPA